MHGKLLLEAFQQVEKTTGFRVVRQQALRLSDIIQELDKESLGERRLRDLRKKAIAGREVRLRPNVAKALCKYLEYDSIEAYYKKHDIKIDPSSGGGIGPNVWVKMGLAALIVLSIASGIWWLQGEGPHRVMVWDGDEFKEVPLDLETYAPKQLQAYSEEKISQLKKVVPDCSTLFFDAQGEALLFYGKNGKGELEFFTALAKHPETGKALKEITPYMIRKYICETY